MPSHLHEALVELFQNRPALTAELLSGQLGVPLPAYEEARSESIDLTDIVPTEYWADTVVVLTDADQPVLAVVVEVQLRRDARTQWTWPAYVARWCAGLFRVDDPGLVLRPVVFGPERVPAVTDAGEACRSPELAVLVGDGTRRCGAGGGEGAVRAAGRAASRRRMIKRTCVLMSCSRRSRRRRGPVWRN